MRGAPISPRIRAGLPTGAILGSAGTAPRPNTRIERTEPDCAPLAPRPRGDRRVRAGFLRVAGLVMILLTVTLPAWADEFAVQVSALGADSFADKEQAVSALGKLGDGRAVSLLT